MRMEEHPSTNPKVDLHKRLQAQASDALKRSKVKNLTLDSFVVSATLYDDLRKKHGLEWDKQKYADAHILFFGDGKDNAYLEEIIAG
mgnify:FL=1